MNKDELFNCVESLKEEMRQLVDNAEIQKRSLTDEEKTQFEDKQRQVDEYKAQIAELDAKQNKENRSEENEIKNNKNIRMNYLTNLAKQVSDVVNNRDLSEYSNMAGNEIELRENAYTQYGDVDDIQLLEYTRVIEPLQNQVVFDKLGLTFVNTGSLVKLPSVTAVQCTLNGENTEILTQKIEYTNKAITPARLAAAVGLSVTAMKAVDNNVNLLAYALKAMRQAEARLINKMIVSPVAVSNDGKTVKGPFVDKLAGDASVAKVANWENIIGLETECKEKNAVITERAAFIMAPATADKLRSKPVALKGNNKIAGFIMEDGKIDGIKVYETNDVKAYDASGNLTCDYIGFCADWQTLIVQEVGAPRMIVDPYTKAKANEIELVLNDDLGFSWERDANFSCMKLDASSWIA